MKKALLIDICAVMLALMMISCTGTPKNQEEVIPVHEFTGSTAEQIPDLDTLNNDFLALEVPHENEVPDAVVFDDEFPGEEITWDEDEFYLFYEEFPDEETILAEEFDEFEDEKPEEVLFEDEFLAIDTPVEDEEILLTEVLGEDEGDEELFLLEDDGSLTFIKPSVFLPDTPAAEQPPVTVSPPVVPPEPPPPVTALPAIPPPPPAPVVPPPPPAERVIANEATEPEPEGEAQPPVIVRELPFRDAPELPNPTPAFTGQLDDRIVFSRTASATVGQLVEVPFRGNGWVHIGEALARRGIVYDSRRIDPDGQSFIFRTESAGVYALRFYRQDFVRDYILNDYVQVIVSDVPEIASADMDRVIAEPRWPSTLEEALRPDSRRTQLPESSIAVQTAPAAPVQSPPVVSPQSTVPVTLAPSIDEVQPVVPPIVVAEQSPALPVTPEPEFPEDILPDEYIRKAREEFDVGRIAPSISLLDQFCRFYPSGSDEAWWLYAQCYEANSPSRDILAALDYYRRLVDEYPQSSRTADARRRISYLERYYINIQ